MISKKYLIKYTMVTRLETTTVMIYFKIPYTDITHTCVVNNRLTTLQLIDYVNVDVRNNLNINPRYDIELVEVGKPDGELAPCVEPRNDETLLQRYHSPNMIAYYARPVHPITREFVRRDNYVE
jgi:hypothetical protein